LQGHNRIAKLLGYTANLAVAAFLEDDFQKGAIAFGAKQLNRCG
jgi:hypothetical protein